MHLSQQKASQYSVNFTKLKFCTQKDMHFQKLVTSVHDDVDRHQYIKMFASLSGVSHAALFKYSLHKSNEMIRQ